ncbi:ABC transporter permease [Caulobacter sp. SLTY]|uniref:ABC transporter permease n=1 Tax=Caulobacter sp. SLTY TaxID=2683262 RepID=UPI0014130CDA|nr:ABC transporter permease [Caulobacter sp. SLTY]NBB15475.1 ABC transporter permease [Caulobacter sp. SLTY]
MIFAMFRVMLLGLLRDRFALAATFLLPPLVFVIFVTVFAGASGEAVRLRLAVADQADSTSSRRLVAALFAEPQLRAQPNRSGNTVDAVREEVRAGRVDAGLVMLSDPAGAGAPFLLITDPTRAMAAPLIESHVQNALAVHVPGIDVGRPRALFLHDPISGAKKGKGMVIYYAGAVTMLFALFSALYGALSLIEERNAGIADRILAGPAGLAPAIGGKFLFIVLQGLLQAGSIFLVAQLLYGAPVKARLLFWLITSGAAATCAAGLAMGLVAFCRNRDQAQLIGVCLFLMLAVIGGAMAPSFTMPPWLQAVGLLTPHAWVIDTYQAVLWRDAGWRSVYPAWGVLTGLGLAGLMLAYVTVRRVRR